MKSVSILFLLAAAGMWVNAGVQNNASPNKPERLYVESYTDNWDDRLHTHTDIYDQMGTIIGSADWERTTHSDHHWNDGAGGDGSTTRLVKGKLKYYDESVTVTSEDCRAQFNWLESSWPDLVDGTATSTGCRPDSTTTPPPQIASEHCDVNVPTNGSWGPDSLDGLYTRQADTKWTLFTGGKGVPKRQNLWVIGASAAEVLEKRWLPYVPGAPTEGIDASKILVDGKPIGSDGRLYVAWPDNTPKDVTPTVDGVDFYIFGVEPTKHKLRIRANDVPLADDRVVLSAKFCVGQKLNVEAVFTPEVPGLNAMYPTWSFTGEQINHHYTDGNGCEIYQIAPYWIVQNPTQVWYYNGGEELNANLGMYCAFDNGQTAYATARGKFSMHRPRIAHWNPFWRGTPQVVIFNGCLSLGTGGGNDMSFQSYLESDFSGTAGYTQLITGEANSNLPITIDGYQLDNVEWIRGTSAINTGNWTQNPVTFYDGPSISLATLTGVSSMDLLFRTYLRFKPGPADGNDNIYVTLRRITWGVSATATRSGGIWSVNPGSGTSGPVQSDITEFPNWVEVFSNLP